MVGSKTKKRGGVMEGWPNQGPESRERKEETVNLLGVNSYSNAVPATPRSVKCHSKRLSSRGAATKSAAGHS